MDATLIPVIATVSGVCMIIAMRYYDNMEKMAMIEKGLMPKRQSFNPNIILRLGCLLVGVGLGLLIGTIIVSVGNLPDGISVAIMLIFGGGGLLVAHYFERKQTPKNDAES
jgi:undecaprenyl pyrophosphate phosphatase UppP